MFRFDVFPPDSVVQNMFYKYIYSFAFSKSIFKLFVISKWSCFEFCHLTFIAVMCSYGCFVKHGSKTCFLISFSSFISALFFKCFKHRSRSLGPFL